MIGRRARLALAGLLALVLLAGCGSSGPSGASPARLAPPNALFYLELTVRPQGAQHDDVQSALTQVIGHSPDAETQRLASRLFAHAGASYSKDIAPWLGQRIGIVITSASSRPDVGLIAPTNDPAGAVAALKRLARHAQLHPAMYRGLHYETATSKGRPLAWGIVSRAAVVASPATFTAIVDASRGRRLTAAPGFRAAMRRIPGTALVSGYADLSALASRLRPILSALPRTPGTPGLPAPVLSALLGRLKGAVGFSLAVHPRAFILDVHSTTPHPSRGADVSGLPGSSWLALAGGTGSQTNMSLLSALREDPAFAAALSGFQQRTGLDLIRDVLPALERVQLSVGGTSPIALGAGVLATPSHPAAGRRLLAGLHRLAARSSSLQVQGNDHAFSIARRGALLPRVFLTEEGSRLVGTLDETVGEFVKPLQPLSEAPRFTTARQQLPPGSRVTMFLDFRALAQLLGGLPSFTNNPKNARGLAILQRVDYLVLGSNSSTGQTRLVLAVR
jgi:hypothetical protein